jgi:thiamine pyrophosphate-dependent acetolactate synthase large subunit-like protein
VQAVSVTRIEQLDDALLAAFRSDIPMLVEVAVERAADLGG